MPEYKRYALVLNGELVSSSVAKSLLKKACHIVAVDGGADHLQIMNVQPDCLIGDFDSVNQSNFLRFKQQKVKVKTFPRRKNFTDGELAINYLLREVIDENALKVKPASIHLDLIAAFGSRYDHLLANQLMAVRLVEEYGISVALTDGESVQFILGPGSHQIQWKAPEQMAFSLIAHREVQALSLEIADPYEPAYPVQNLDLHVGTCLGVSNNLKFKIGRPIANDLPKKIDFKLSLVQGIVSLIITPGV